MRKVILVRHCESESVIAQSSTALLDDADNGLTEAGAAMAADLGRRLRSLITRPLVYASPMRRTRETADIISQVTEWRVQFDEALRERAFGLQPTASYSDLRQFQLECYAKVNLQLGGGESLATQRERVFSFCSRSMLEAKEDILVLTHGDVIEHIWAWIWGSNLDVISRAFIRSDPGHFHQWTVLQSDDDRNVWRLEAVNLPPL